MTAVESYSGLWVSLKEYVDTIFHEREKATQSQFELRDRDLVLARESVTQKMEELNKLRRAVEEDRGLLTPKIETDGLKQAISVLRSEFVSHRLENETRLTRIESRAIRWSTVISAIAILVSILLKWWPK